jgi:acetoin utilization protein AcuB
MGKPSTAASRHNPYTLAEAGSGLKDIGQRGPLASVQNNQRGDSMIHTLCEPHSTLSMQQTLVSEPRQSLRVGDIMSVSPVTITPSTSVHAAQALMQQRKIRHLPVLKDGRLVGMISDRDIRLVLPSPATSLTVWEIRHLLDKLTVGEVMTYFVMTTAPDCPVTEAVGRMLGHRVGALPVVEDHQVIGILTRTDVLRAFRRLHAELLAVA